MEYQIGLVDYTREGLSQLVKSRNDRVVTWCMSTPGAIPGKMAFESPTIIKADHLWFLGGSNISCLIALTRTMLQQDT